MRKISIVSSLKSGAHTLKSNWKVNQKPGYQVSIKSFVGMCIASMGTEAAEKVMNYLDFSATSAVVGLIFGLSIKSTYVISSMGLVLNLIFMPIISNITDNMGVLKKSTRKKINISGILVLLSCTTLFYIPTTAFDFILPDFLKHIAIIVSVKYASIYMYILIYRFFGEKYGKYKPLILFLGIPSILMATALVYLPYQNMKPQTLLLAVSLISAIMTTFSTPYRLSYEKMQNLLTTNNKERTFIFSIFPILTGLLRSLIAVFLPLMATISGYELNSIGLYRIVIPLFGTVSVAVSFFIMWTEENIKSVPKSEEETTSMWEDAKEVFSNKYLWITMVSKAFEKVSAFDLILLEWVILYSIRQQWILGILAALTALPSTPGNLITPLLTKRFDSRKLLMFMQFAQVVVVCLNVPILLSGNDTVIIIGLTAIGALTTIFNVPKVILKKTCKAQALDYHQWRFGGKRVDESANLFEFVSMPIMLALGLLSPLFMGMVGFVNDRDVLYDPTISKNVFILLVVLYVLELLGSAAFYFFFDLDDKKLAQIQSDLAERELARKAEEANLVEQDEQVLQQVQVGVNGEE